MRAAPRASRLRPGAGNALASSLLGLALVVGGLARASAASPVPVASPVPAGSIVADAIARLDDLASYRFQTTATADSAPGVVTGLAGVIIREPELAWQMATLQDGEPAMIQIVDGDEGWISILGSAFRSMEEMSGSVPEEPPMTFLDLITRWADQRVPMTLVGQETRDGADVLHFRGQTETLEVSPDPNGYYQPSLNGILDIWVDAAGGHLVAATGDVIDVSSTFSNRGHPVSRHVEVQILGVDDPANQVSHPGPAVPLPSLVPGDPALAAMVEQAFAAMADLDSYRVESNSAVYGFQSDMESIVIQRPTQAARSILWVDGDEFIAYQEIDGVSYTRKHADAPWVVTPVEKMPTCNDVPCGFESAAGFGALPKTVGGGFQLVGEETIDGIATIRVRSEAPFDYPDLGPVPQVTDLWIAKDLGYLKQVVVDGVGQYSAIKVSGENDPANVLEAPASPAPSAAPSSAP